jgi:hypothetical protein
VNQNVEDEAAAGAAARATCDVSTLRGTYLFADHGVYAPTGKQFAEAGYAYFDGNGNIHGVFSIRRLSRSARAEAATPRCPKPFLGFTRRSGA